MLVLDHLYVSIFALLTLIKLISQPAAMVNSTPRIAATATKGIRTAMATKKNPRQNFFSMGVIRLVLIELVAVSTALNKAPIAAVRVDVGVGVKSDERTHH